MADVVGYIPTVSISRSPAGVGTVNEDYNRISAGFINRFDANGIATVYFLSSSNLNNTVVLVSVSNVDLIENVGFTVDRTSGSINFGAGTSPFGAPSALDDSVVIEAYVTRTTIEDTILDCKFSEVFSGANDSRVFVGGNGTSFIYWSAVSDPTYFPDNNYKELGSDEEGISGFGKQYDLLIVFKNHSVYRVNYSFVNNVVSFPSVTLCTNVGCDMPYTIQNIDNKLVWCNTYTGVCILSSTVLDNEKNVRQISININNPNNVFGLLANAKADMILATSCNWDIYKKYLICVKDRVWMWDYGISPYIDTGNIDSDQIKMSWWYLNNINANCFYDDNNELYYGSRTNGSINHFIQAFNDFGVAIPAEYKLPITNFGISNWLKTVKELTVESNAGVSSKIDIVYSDNRGNRNEPNSMIETSIIGQSFTRYPNSKHINYWSALFSNNYINSDMSIISILIKWIRSKKNK